MKTFAPKRSIKDLSNILLFEKLTVLDLKTLSILFILIFVNFSVSAQVARYDEDAPKIMEVQDFISTLKSNNSTARKSKPEKTNLEKLLFDVQPSIYFNSGDVKTYGENPKNFFVDFQYLNQVNNSNLLINNIEIVTIKINNKSELNSIIDLSLFSNFKKLKYVYISTNISIDESIISKMIRNYDEKYTVIYGVEKGA